MNNFCGSCGKPMVSGAKFCGTCGVGSGVAVATAPDSRGHQTAAPNQQVQTPQPYHQGIVVPLASGEQRCPTCGRINGPLVRFCSSCGAAASPSAVAMPPAFVPQYVTSSSKRMGLGIKLVIVCGSLFVALIVVSALYQATPEGQAAVVAKEKDRADKETQREQNGAERQKQQAAIEKERAISASTLMAAYERNEVNADNEYKGKVVVVQGRIGTIAKDITDTSYVTLDESELSIGSIQCFFDDSSNVRLAKLSPGESIYIKGTVDGKMMNVLIKHSRILE